MIDRHQRLTDQLNVIGDVLAIATAVTDDERQQELLAVIGRAMTAAQTEHHDGLAEDKQRPKLRLIIGGLGGIAPAGVCAATLARIRHHHRAVTAAAGTAAISLAVGALVLFGHTPPGPDEAQGPPAATSTSLPESAAPEAPAASPPPRPDASTPNPGPAPTGPPSSAASTETGPASPTQGHSELVDLADPTLTTPAAANTDDDSFTQPAPSLTVGSPSPAWTAPPSEDPPATPTHKGRPNRIGLCAHLSVPPVLRGGVCLLGA